MLTFPKISRSLFIVYLGVTFPLFFYFYFVLAVKIGLIHIAKWVILFGDKQVRLDLGDPASIWQTGWLRRQQRIFCEIDRELIGCLYFRRERIGRDKTLTERKTLCTTSFSEGHCAVSRTCAKSLFARLSLHLPLLSSSIFSYWSVVRLSRIGNISSHLHSMMFPSIQTIYFLWGNDPGNMSVSAYAELSPVYCCLVSSNL